MSNRQSDNDGVRKYDPDVKQIIENGTIAAKEPIKACLSTNTFESGTLSSILNNAITNEAKSYFEKIGVKPVSMNLQGRKRWLYIVGGQYGIFLKGAHNGMPCNVKTQLDSQLMDSPRFDVEKFGELELYTYGYKHNELRTDLVSIDLFQARGGKYVCLDHIHSEDDTPVLKLPVETTNDETKQIKKQERWKPKDGKSDGKSGISGEAAS